MDFTIILSPRTMRLSSLMSLDLKPKYSLAWKEKDKTQKSV